MGTFWILFAREANGLSSPDRTLDPGYRIINGRRYSKVKTAVQGVGWTSAQAGKEAGPAIAQFCPVPFMLVFLSLESGKGNEMESQMNTQPDGNITVHPKHTCLIFLEAVPLQKRLILNDNDSNRMAHNLFVRARGGGWRSGCYPTFIDEKNFRQSQQTKVFINQESCLVY